MRNSLALSVLWMPLLLSACGDAVPREGAEQAPVAEAEFGIAYGVSGAPNVAGLMLFVDEKHDIVSYGVRGEENFSNSAQTEPAILCESSSFSCIRFEGWPPIVSGRPDGALVDKKYTVGDRSIIDGKLGCYAYSTTDRTDPSVSTYSMTCDPYGVVFFSFRKGSVAINHSLKSYAGLFRAELAG